MSEIPVISVVIDTYNYGHYIDQAINSVLEQTFPPSRREIIVIDDGSTDDTPERALKYAGHITYLRKPNGGQASAFNAGIAAARGDIICMLDADDYFYPRKLDEVYDEFTRHPGVGVVYNRYDVVDESGNIVVRAAPTSLKRGDLAGRTLLGFPSGSPSSGISALRSVMASIMIPEEPFRISADYFYLNILPLVARVGVVSTSLHAYRKHDTNSYLKRSSADRQAIHARQTGTVWDYAERRLGKSFFGALCDRAEAQEALTPVLQTRVLAAGIRYLSQVHAPLSLKLWSLAKLTAQTAVTRNMFLRMRAWRDRLFGQGSRY